MDCLWLGPERPLPFPISLIWFFEFTYDAAYALSEGTARFVPWIVLAILLLIMLVSRMFNARRNARSDKSEQGPDEPS